MKMLIATVLFLLVGNYAIAGDRVIDCQIDSGDETIYEGKCKFMPDGGGSFTLAHPRANRNLTSELMMVSVSIVERGYADVRGLTTSGINSRWGEAKRSSRDRACWIGSDFKICAW